MQFNPYEIISGDLSKGLVLFCDHACNGLPEQYGNLGLDKKELERHIAYDIGAEGLTRGLAHKLGVPAVLATFSRLLIDPNRGKDDPTLVRQLYDGTIIPGNYPLSKQELNYRINHFYQPYHQAIADMLKRFENINLIPAVFSVHTMTDIWNGQKRPWNASILWDSDDRFALPMLEALRAIKGLTIGDNQPYDGALGGDSMFKHCTSNGLAHALLEVRQDLVKTQEGIDSWVNLLAPLVENVNQRPDIHVKKYYGSRTGIPIAG